MRMYSDRIIKCRAQRGLVEALRLGGRRGDHEPFGIKRHAHDVLKNFTYQSTALSEFEIGTDLGPYVGVGDQDDVALMQAVDNRASVNIRM
jgi:hypothetical protein